MTTSSRYKGTITNPSGSYPEEDGLSQITVPGDLPCVEDDVLHESFTAPKYPDVVLADAPTPDGEDLTRTELLTTELTERPAEELHQSATQSSPRGGLQRESSRNRPHRSLPKDYRESGGGGGGSGRRVRKETHATQSNRKRSSNNPNFELLIVPEQGILDYLISTVALWLERLRDSMIRVLTPSSSAVKPSFPATLPEEQPLSLSSKKERKTAGRRHPKEQ
jgi:hypothetical protein